MLQEELRLPQKFTKDLTEQMSSSKVLGTMRETVRKTEKGQAVKKE